MSRFRVKLNYTPALLYPHACVARVRIRTSSHARIRITVAVANEPWRALYILANIRECALAGGPLFEKIRLDNATIQWHNRKVEAVVGLNKNKQCGSMTEKDGTGWLERFGNGSILTLPDLCTCWVYTCTYIRTLEIFLYGFPTRCSM